MKTKNAVLEVKKHSSMTYRIYDFLKAMHTGADKKTTQRKVANSFGITQRCMRRIASTINSSGELEKIVSTSDGCYICETEEECIKAIVNTYKKGWAEIRKANAMLKKYQRNGQMKLPLGKYYKEFVETYTRDEKV